MVVNTSLRFAVAFHGPFRVGTGSATPGFHQTAWRVQRADEVLVAPASTVKGVMRAAASELLQPDTVAAVFGGAGSASPWSWSPLTVPATAVGSRLRTRIAVGPTGTVEGDMLAVGQELLIDAPGTFSIGRLPFVSLTDADLVWHSAALTVAASLVKAMGGTRRRGLGWVSVQLAADPAAGDRGGVVEAAVDAIASRLVAAP